MTQFCDVPNFTETTYARIRQKINQQARTFMPYITINNIQFSPSDIDNGKLSIVINYVVPSLKSQDVLTFNV